MARRHPVVTRRLTRRGHATRRRPRRGLTLQRHEHGVPKSDCRPRHPVASVGEENPCPWWCSGSIRTSSPIRPPPWPPGHSNSSAAFGSPPAPPAMSSCWAGPDSSRNGAGRSRTPRGLGCHLTQWLLARGETVQDVRTTATARIRELSRGRGRKTDALDAAAAAGIAALQGDAEQLQPEDATVVLAVLEERRSNQVGQRTRSVNQLHAVLRALIPGGAPRKLRADRAAALLRGLRPMTAADRARKQVAWDLVAEVRGLDRRLAMMGNRIQDTVAALAAGCPRPLASARSSLAGCLAAPDGRRGSPPRRTSPATPAPLPSRSPGENALGTACPALVTGSSTTPCTSSPWSRSAPRAAPATTTPGANSPRV